MIRRAVAVLVISILFASDLAVAQDAAGKAPDNAARAKLFLASIPVGTYIDVMLMQEGSRKITGKLVAVSEDSLEVQYVKSGTISSQKIALVDVRSVKKHGMSRGKKVKIALLVLAPFVVVGVVGVAGGIPTN
jgi:hypothetical protein